MENLNQIYRKNNRRVEERRRYARRIIKHAFGSKEWKQVMQASYVFWPKEDRRVDERRSVNRRLVERRTGLENYRRQSLRQQALRRNGQRQRLTSEELKMISDLNNRSQ